MNLLDNTPNQRSKFRTKNRAEINDTSPWTYNANNQIRFKTSMLKSSLCDYSHAYILIKETISIPGRGVGVAAIQADEKEKRVIFKNWASFTELD